MSNFDVRRISIVILRKLHKQVKRQYLASCYLLASITFPCFLIVQQLILHPSTYQVSVLNQESALDDLEIGSGKYLGMNKAQYMVYQHAKDTGLEAWKTAEVLFSHSPFPKFVWVRPSYYVLLFFYTLF